MAEFDKDDMVPPSWLDQIFFEKVLHHFNASASLIDFRITPGCKPGEHFNSVMFKVSLIYLINEQRHTLNTILKTVPEVEGYKKECVEKTPCFKNELRVYNRVLPKMQEVLSAVGDTTKIAPR